MAETEKYVGVGKLGKTRGVRGEIYVTPTTDFPERFLDLKEIHVNNRGRWEKMEIASAQLIAGRPVLKFEDIDTPEEASRLTNRELAVTDNQLIKLPNGTFFIFDLVGCIVLDVAGNELGEVVDIQRYPANDVYVIKTGTGKEVLFPAVKKFVRQVDVRKRRIMVEPGDLFDQEWSSSKR